ncbi:MAG: hypothetical protein B7C24_06310 [Bacteroidetes bacterium 4572_77]|nr:MAG: hypothetical protein B7C24_06310 [Bacteroidetes bacterium 4572_77]
MEAIKLFQDQRVRVQWDEKQEKWFFSIVDVIRVLTESENPRKYWSVLKTRLKKEGSEVATNCSRLKLLIQSIPSPKAEPFKVWLAKVGYERIEETEDPEKAFDRAMETYLKKGYSKNWINQRLKSIEVRKELTDEWEIRGVKKGLEYAILTDEITQAWAGLSTREYKNLKKLKKENLRDNMTNLELVLNMLAETSTTELSKKEEPKTFLENKKVARDGGSVAGNARKDLEKKLGNSVVKPLNARKLRNELEENNDYE